MSKSQSLNQIYENCYTKKGASTTLPGPWKAGRAPIPKCGTEHRHLPFIAGGEYAHYEPNQSSYWPNTQWRRDDEEEEEGERLSEDDISTDEYDGYDSSEEEGAWSTSPIR